MTTNKLPNKRIYYSQNREDLILESFFLDIKKGFYVDVGACHPDVASVTKRFYLKGWRGINIEPQKNLHGLFVQDRKRDININSCVSDQEGTLTLRSYTNNQGLSSVVANLKQEHQSKNTDNTDAYEDIAVPAIKLQTIFQENSVEFINFLKVDVEGYEYEVLNSNNWTKYRPEVVCVEANHIVKDWRPILHDNGYKKVFFDGLNDYFVDLNTERERSFSYVDHVIVDLDGGISAEDFDELARVRRSVETLKTDLAAKQKELNSVKNMIYNSFKLIPKRIKSKRRVSKEGKNQ